MAYTDFSLAELETRFGVSNQVKPLFDPLPPLTPSDWLQTSLRAAGELPVRSEKARSEGIVFPILVEMRSRNEKFFTIYSGDNLNADSSRGLNGECDFILTKDTGTFDINYPIIHIVEAKRNDLEIGVPQCAAQLVGARIFNESKKVTIPQLTGCVTTGNEWLFIRLTDHLEIDRRIYYLNELGELLAVFQQLVDYYRLILT
jgi:hypothetical protein